MCISGVWRKGDEEQMLAGGDFCPRVKTTVVRHEGLSASVTTTTKMATTTNILLLPKTARTRPVKVDTLHYGNQGIRLALHTT
jgi:hypothetical protein